MRRIDGLHTDLADARTAAMITGCEAGGIAFPAGAADRSAIGSVCILEAATSRRPRPLRGGHRVFAGVNSPRSPCSG